jgi:hypothetical protein
MLLTNQKTINYENLLQIAEQTTSLLLLCKDRVLFYIILNKKQTLTYFYQK